MTDCRSCKTYKEMLSSNKAVWEAALDNERRRTKICLDALKKAGIKVDISD